MHAQLRKEWPQYQIFIRCGTRMHSRSNSNRSEKNKRKHTYFYSIITMMHKSAGSALDSFQHVKAHGLTEAVYLLSRFGLTEDLFFLFQMCTIMLLLRADSRRPSLTSLVPAYYTLNHSVTFICLVATTTHPLS